LDHFLTKEEFQVFQCFSCGLLFTNPRPDTDQLPAYYKSEEYISHSNTSKGLLNKLYQIVRRSTLKWKGKVISEYFPDGSILDIGCGTGYFLNHMKTLGWTTLGIEPDALARKAASENHQLDVRDESELSSLDSGSFDVVTLWHVLEHVIDINHRLEEVHRLLKPKGILVLALPNPSSYDAIHYNSFWAAWDVPRHLYHFNPKALHGIVSKLGFEFLASKGMVFDAYYISMISEKYKGSKLFPLKGFISGFISNRKARKGEESYSSMCYFFRKSDLN